MLFGTSGAAGVFTPAVIRAMAKWCARPIIFALSNPTSQAECTPTEALEHSEGRALVATGSPFPSVTLNGTEHRIGQCNNCFVFPGVGLGAMMSEVSRVPDEVFLAAADALAEFTRANAPAEALFPSLQDLRAVSRHVAFRVAQQARDYGLGRTIEDDVIEAELDQMIWAPEYPDLELDTDGV
jgi:malate dehydrogenase (oxaloacetate-decarboxylating)